jgi:hypothetical protein
MLSWMAKGTAEGCSEHGTGTVFLPPAAPPTPCPGAHYPRAPCPLCQPLSIHCHTLPGESHAVFALCHATEWLAKSSRGSRAMPCYFSREARWQCIDRFVVCQVAGTGLKQATDSVIAVSPARPACLTKQGTYIKLAREWLAV